MQYQFKLTGSQRMALYRHLFPGDGLEAVSIVLCGKHQGHSQTILLGREVIHIAYEDCKRKVDLITWKTELLLPIIDKAETEGLAIVKIHSHPNGYPKFSSQDDESDRGLFEAIINCSAGGGCNGSTVMLPNGILFGRAIDAQTSFIPFTKISIVGDELRQFRSEANTHEEVADFAERNAQTFGSRTQNQLSKMKVGVVGCSGTGSPVIEQLVRLGVGEMVCVDPDVIEVKNLNRILNSRFADAKEALLKVKLVTRTINEIGLGTKCTEYASDIYDSKDAQFDLMTSDFIFGCMDGARGRQLLNQLSTLYLIPYLDMGVRIDADGQGGISKVVGVVHYLQPGRSSLMTRGVYTSEQISAEGLQREDPEEYARRFEEKYIHGSMEGVGSPAVIPLNMNIASAAVLEFLNRINAFRDDPPKHYARIIFDLSNVETEKTKENEMEIDERLSKWIGIGDCEPLLMMPELSMSDAITRIGLHGVSS